MAGKTDATVTTAIKTGGDSAPNKLVRILGWIGVVILGLVVIGAILFFVPATKPLINRYLGIATPQTSGPCSGDANLINKYNKIMSTAGIVGAKDLTTGSRQKAGYASDPSCVYLSMMGYYGEGNTTKALSEHEVLGDLKLHGKLPSAAIKDGVDQKVLLDTLERIRDEKPDNPYAQG